MKEDETLDEYWKRLVDIEKKCEFSRISPEETIIYKFAARINDKKARDKLTDPTELTESTDPTERKDGTHPRFNAVRRDLEKLIEK